MKLNLLVSDMGSPINYSTNFHRREIRILIGLGGALSGRGE
jgi:hypothetical protein